MKNIKHLLFLSILCSLVLFTNCGDSDDPVADDNIDDGSTTVLDGDGDGVVDNDDTFYDDTIRKYEKKFFIECNILVFNKN